MNYIAKVSSTVSSVIPWNIKDTADTNLVSNKDILKIASILNNSQAYIDTQLVNLPKLVVVGTQSSGKSSLLNAITGMDILPVGKSMTTRTPLHLELIQSSSETRVEFGRYTDTHWNTEKRIAIQHPSLTPEQRDCIRNEIELLTNIHAGQGMNISPTPIFIKIYAPCVPNLHLVDLPGLTSVAITERGQPRDIKDQIIQLVQSYIVQPNAILLAVITARPDIEADMAMEIVKVADPKGVRTVGILTKLDLMNEDADVGAYLENNVSSDLRLKYGYFGIRNRGFVSAVSQPNTPLSSTITQLSIPEIIQNEKSYFASHSVYRQDKYKARLGIPNLCQSLSSILIYNIKLCLPVVLQNIQHQLQSIQTELASLGSSIPADKDVRMTILNGLLTTYIKSFTSAIDQRGSSWTTGRQIKDTFGDYRTQIGSLNPFDTMDDSVLLELLKSYDGIHMSFPYLPIEILENCLRNRTYMPIRKLIEPSLTCLTQTLDHLHALNQQILDTTPLKKYPNLMKHIKQVVLTEILPPRVKHTEEYISHMIEQEESYIWTDDAEFQRLMLSDFSRIISTQSSSTSFDIPKFKMILYAYYKTIVRNVREVIPKCIIYHLVKSTMDTLTATLFERILTLDTMTLLEEFPEIEERRKVLEKSSKDLLEVKLLIEGVL